MAREYYSDSINSFLGTSPTEILGELNKSSPFSVEPSQRDAWLEQIRILKRILPPHQGSIYFEYSIPRMGRRIDTVLLIGSVIFVLEFKVGEHEFPAHAIDQVWDYALDLKNFHATSHIPLIAPILISTNAPATLQVIAQTPKNDNLLIPIKTNADLLGEVLMNVLRFAGGNDIDRGQWEAGRYSPTPTIIEAARALYAGHSVEEISRSDAGATNLKRTSAAISAIIASSKKDSRKSICFLTGVPGAGKTLVGLDIAKKHFDPKNALHAVLLSGNGPLVNILQEALALDSHAHEKAQGKKYTKGEARRAVKSFIQAIHHFRDEYLDDLGPPDEHVTLFDEAQRAWNVQKLSNFMRQKRGRADFNQSEPEFLISCLDRHRDWAVIVCLVGGGQEINEGEAGITEWIESLNRSYPKWDIHISSRLTDSEYAAGNALKTLESRDNIHRNDDLHLAVSMRSYRAEHVSLLIKQLLDRKVNEARTTLANVSANYPIVITRDLSKAKKWLKAQARGSERYGLVVSSQAERLKPQAIDVRVDIDPIHWFLKGKEDVRSSYYLEDVATEFAVQGLELDWTCVIWDADFRCSAKGWDNHFFVGSKWKNIHKPENQIYQKNAYRVLLTRARQGMIIVVPEGAPDDPTRMPEFYDPTFDYLKSIGFPII